MELTSKKYLSVFTTLTDGHVPQIFKIISHIRPNPNLIILQSVNTPSTQKQHGNTSLS